MPDAPLDLVVQGGRIIDGSADAVPFVADIGIAGDRIVAIGDLATVDATATIQAAGLTVAPGFIDPHTHVETAILDERADALAPPRQGVTTVLTAPDGFGWAPLDPPAAAELWAGTAGIHGKRPRALASATIAGYLDGFAGITPVNVLPQVPHAAVRFGVMGWRDGPANAAAIDGMRGLVDDWMAAGATGLAVGLDYEPGGRAPEAELRSLCERVAAHGGTLAAHIRYEDLGRPAGYAEMARIGRATGVRVSLAHERLDDIGATALAAANDAADVGIEAYPYGPSSTQLTICLPAHLRQGGPASMAERQSRPEGRAAVAEALKTRLVADRAAGDRVVFGASSRRERIGREIFDVAAAEGQDVGDFAAALLVIDPAALFIYHHDGRPDPDQAFQRTITDPTTIVASDGIYVDGRMHPRGYGTFPRVLGRYVRERGALSLVAAIHAMTGRTAARYRVPDRGLIAVGAVADLVVFDAATIADEATFDAPRRPPAGIVHVLVNGRAVIASGIPTAARPGSVLAAR